MSVYVARQPVLNKQNRVVAYEVFYRSSATNIANIQDDTLKATVQVLIRILGSFESDRVLQKKIGHVNVDNKIINSPLFEKFPKNNFVYEVNDFANIDVYTIERLKTLKSSGYRFSVGDIEYSDEFFKKLIENITLFETIKIEVLNRDFDKIKNFIDSVKLHTEEITFTAIKVETNHIYDLCEQIGFDYFQGYFFAKPK